MKMLVGGRHSALFHVVTAAVAALACMIFFFRAQPVDLYHHNLLMGYLNRLQRDEALLGEEVMRMGFYLANDYDQITAIARRLRNAVRELRAGDAGSMVRNDTAFLLQLGLVEQRLQGKFDALEKFKSKNSILKNSLIYLPHLRDVLQKTLTPGQPVHERLDQLIELVLLHNSNATILDRGHLGELIVQLEDDMKRLPLGELQDEFKVLLRHAHLVIDLSSDLHGLQAQLGSPENGEGLSEAYRYYYDRQVMRTSEYRTYLLLTMLGLFAYAVYFYLGWRERTLLEQARSMRLAAAVFESQEGMMVSDANNLILRVNNAFMKITGYTSEEVVGKNPRLLKSGRHDENFYAAMWNSIKSTDAWEGEVWNRRKNGEIYPEHLTITAVKDADGKIANYVATLNDITLSKMAEEEIKRLAFQDPLTRLPNRRLLLDRMQHALESSARSGKFLALLFIDLDHFKNLNDTLGHDFGDLLLQQVAKRLTACLRKSDTVARLGGDEFVVMLEALSKDETEAAAQAKMVSDKILTALNRPYQLGQYKHHSSPSIGATIAKDRESSVDELLKQADAAMYQSKKSGRNTLSFFDPTMQDAIALSSISK
ncbi:MAG: diguanylate cyclase [Candidatus Thiodiazotropha sp.]|jgi:diguanylate cyclase (GGDEF)-like protein/PAS domain S-box-containing protein